MTGLNMPNYNALVVNSILKGSFKSPDRGKAQTL